MQSEADILVQWRYLRRLLMQQLGAFERGDYRIVSEGTDVSPAAILRLKKNILEFDRLIASADARAAAAEAEATVH